MSDANLDSDAAPNSGTDTAGVKEVTFVGWEPGVEDHAKPKYAPRLHHKKSRAGCQQCRARRVKVRRLIARNNFLNYQTSLCPFVMNSLSPFQSNV
jgi:hypothetical protein